MRYRLATVLLLALTAAPAAAQVETPPNCHWVGADPRAATVELWCRDPDGRARPTGRMLQQSTTAAPDCPAGKVYDGARCVAEAQALAATPQAPYATPPQVVIPGPTPRSRAPRVLLFRDGGRDRGMACIDDREVTVCKPIPIQ